MADPLELEARKRIYDTICKFPGIHMRELQRKTAMATGSLDYHLHFLYKHGMLRVEKEGRFTRYYNAFQAYSDIEKRIIAVLRQEPLRHIILYLLERKSATATEISIACGIQPSNLSGHLKSLEISGMVAYKKNGRFRNYEIRDKDIMVKYLVVHKKSFVDKLVDNFISAWLDD